MPAARLGSPIKGQTETEKWTYLNGWPFFGALFVSAMLATTNASASDKSTIPGCSNLTDVRVREWQPVIIRLHKPKDSAVSARSAENSGYSVL
jgi:hypothetical protein